MKTCTMRRLVCWTVGSLLAASVAAVPPWQDWATAESAHFRVHFVPGGAGERLAPHVLAIAEAEHAELSRRLGWTPRARTELVLSDESDLPNGMSSPLPFNGQVLYLAVPRAPSMLAAFDDWLRVLIRHEYTHTLHLDLAGGAPAGLRRVFGRFPWLFPNALQPLWPIEGLAVDLETDQNAPAPVGRGRDGVFDMMMRVEYAAGLKPLAQVNLRIATWPAGHTPYLYGAWFMRFLRERHGADAPERWAHAYGRNLVPFRVDGTARRVFGRDLAALWREFDDWLAARYRPQIEAIEAAGRVEGRRLTEAGFRSGLLRLAPDGGLYHLRDDGRSQPRLERLDAEGRVQRRWRSRPLATLDADPDGGVLLVLPEVCANDRLFFDLYRLAPDGSRRRLTRCGRHPAAAWAPGGRALAAVQNAADHDRLVYLGLDGDREVLWTGDGGLRVAGLDWLPDGSALVASVWHEGRWDLARFDLAARRWTLLTDDPWQQSDPQVDGSGRWVYYSSDEDGVPDIWRLDLADGERQRLTRVLGGAFAPVYDSAADRLYYRGYGPRGYDVYRLDAPRALESRPGGPPRPLPPAAAVTAARPIAARPYTPWPSLRPRWWFPWAAGGADAVSVGAVTGGADALRLHQYQVGLAWELRSDMALGFIDYLYGDRLALHFERDADVYLVDPDDPDNEALERLRVHDRGWAEWRLPWRRVDWRAALVLGAALERSRDVERAPGVPARPDQDHAVAGAALLYDSTDRFNYAISDSAGQRLALVYENGAGLGGDDPGRMRRLDWRVYLPLGGEHVLAGRWLEAAGDADAWPLELGGDPETTDGALFGRRRWALRGYPLGLPALRGTQARLVGLEWRLPLARIERTAMVPPIGIHQLHATVFYEAGRAWAHDAAAPGADELLRGAGVELNADLALFYDSLGVLQLRLGFARGLDEGGEDRVYLSLGAAF